MAKKKKQGALAARENAVGLGLLVLTAALVVLLAALGALDSNGPAVGGAEGEIQISSESPVRFSEIMSSNASALIMADGNAPDWIELANTGDSAVNLSGYALMMDDDPTRMYRFAGTTLPAGGHLVLLADGESMDGHLPFKLASSGQKLTLMNTAGQTVDAVRTPALDEDQVYCCNAEGAWQMSMNATPGEANQTGASSPEDALVTDSPVVISEVMTRNATYAADENGNFWDYIELTNRSDSEASLAGWFLTDDRAVVARWKFPDVTIPAGGSLLVYCSGYDNSDDLNNIHASFRLSGDGTEVILTCNESHTASMVEVPALETDQAYSLVDGEWTTNLGPTPRAANNATNAAIASDALRQSSNSGVIISEIAAATSTDTPDWIELYNAGSQPVDLTNWGLSDNAARPRKWQFPGGTVLHPGQYSAVFCDGSDKIADGALFTNFNLSIDGGYSVTLSKPDGTVVDRTYLPKQYEDVTYGRINGLSGFYYFTQSTPLANNGTSAYLGKAETAEYSVRGGLYNTGETLQVELTAQPGARIYYTLDCTDPTQNSNLYTGPITITGTTILRTRVYADNHLESFMDTQSYLYDVNNGNGSHVVSLVSDPYNLFSDEAGIMAMGPNAEPEPPYRGANFHYDWEREAHVEIFVENGTQAVSSECGIQIQGQGTRSHPQKPFKVIARNKYGNNRFEYPLFSERDYTEYQSFVLRTSGQDDAQTRLRDMVLSTLARDTSLIYMEAEIGVVYLNGEYWGHYNIRERINPESICQHEGWEGDEDKIDLIKSNAIVMQGSNKDFDELSAWAKKTDQTADTFYDTIAQYVDIQNFMEYTALQIFVGNPDTPNVKRYRNTNADGKWHWALFDLDRAFYHDSDSINRWLNPEGVGVNNVTDNRLFVACMKNPRFRDEFLTYMGEMLATTYSTENVLSLLQPYYEELALLMPDHMERWGMTEKTFNNFISKFRDYAEERPMKLMGYFANTSRLNLTNEEMERYFGKARDVAMAYSAKAE